MSIHLKQDRIDDALERIKNGDDVPSILQSVYSLGFQAGHKKAWYDSTEDFVMRLDKLKGELT